LQAIQERQEATQIMAEMGAKAVGDLAQYMNWEDGSPQKIALHGLVGYLSAKVGGGNVAASTLSAMGSEYINTEIANYLKENTALTEDQRNAIQQASAAGLGALIGAGLGGDSNTVNQSAQMALRTEQFNRQLHPDEIQWIKDNAEKFAKEQGIDKETAEKRLIAQAAQEVDFFWEKMIGENDFAASQFLKTSSGFMGDVPVGSQQTFINAEGKKQALFSATDDEKKATGLYADKLRAYDEQNHRIFTNAVQPKINNHVIPQSIKDSVVNTAKSTAYALDNPKETIQGIGAATMDCALTGDCIKNAWNSFDSASGQLFRKGYKQADVDYLYGKDMSTEVTAIQGARIALGMTEIAPVGKALSVGYKQGLNALPKTQIDNPYSPYLEIDKYGNEIYYRTLSEPDYKRLLIEGRLPATNETFISPLAEYSKNYEGVLVKFTTKPGTSLMLQEIGVVGNYVTQKYVFPNMLRAEKGWAENNKVQFKLEGKHRDIPINKGFGVVNTGLGKSDGLNKFNENIIKFEKMDKE
ncbi:hypothetical protein, partial [Ursidibacter sp. B-7004-1]